MGRCVRPSWGDADQTGVSEPVHGHSLMLSLGHSASIQPVGPCQEPQEERGPQLLLPGMCVASLPPLQPEAGLLGLACSSTGTPTWLSKEQKIPGEDKCVVSAPPQFPGRGRACSCRSRN